MQPFLRTFLRPSFVMVLIFLYHKGKTGFRPPEFRCDSTFEPESLNSCRTVDFFVPQIMVFLKTVLVLEIHIGQLHLPFLYTDYRFRTYYYTYNNGPMRHMCAVQIDFLFEKKQKKFVHVLNIIFFKSINCPRKKNNVGTAECY